MTPACLPVTTRHTSGEPIPCVEYTPEEVAVWGTALSKLKELYPKHACRQVNEGLPKLGFREDEVPQLQDISDTLKAATGWQVGRVGALWVLVPLAAQRPSLTKRHFCRCGPPRD